jgi:hypothetical protein
MTDRAAITTERQPIPVAVERTDAEPPTAEDGDGLATTGPMLGYVKGKWRVIGRWVHECEPPAP